MSLISALKVIINFLEKNKIPYMVIGGIANSMFGEPRQTFDIDIKIKIGEQINIKELINKLKNISDFFTENPLSFAEKVRVIPIILEGTKIDLIFADLEYEQKAIKNSVRKKFDSININVCKPEDLIIQKSISEREKDWNDIKKIIEINRSKLDKKYILKYCTELSDWLSKPDLINKIKNCLDEK